MGAENARDLGGLAMVEDAQLVTRLREGDETAFRELVRRMHGALHKVALAFVGSPAAAEEVVQDTWLAVISQLDAFEGRSSLRTWIGAILVNQAKTRGARRQAIDAVPALATEETEPVEPERFATSGYWCVPPRRWDDGPESLVLRKEARQAIEAELGGLPAAQHTVVTLRDLEGWSSRRCVTFSA